MNLGLFLPRTHIAQLPSTENICPRQFPAKLRNWRISLGLFLVPPVESFPSFLPCRADFLGHSTVEFDKILAN